jgi:SAM-dependent methyltransferase
MPPSASFRDPGGRVVLRDGRVFREVNAAGRECLDAALGSATVQSLIERGRFVRTTVVSAELAEHELIPFPSFPYEWPPEMLAAAGALTLDLTEGLASENLGLKDATPFNILFRGAESVFIDVLSVERRDPHDPIWLARAQFIRTFLLPLAAARYFGIPLAQVFAQREGIEPDAFYRMLTPAERLLPRYLSLVSMPVWLAAKHDLDDAAIYRPRRVDDSEKCAFILGRNFAALRRGLARLEPKASRESTWSEYMGEKASSYTPEQFAEKEVFVSEAIREAAPKRVLDVGANTGHFSAIAARSGASVVAIDSDEAVAGAIWRRASGEKLDILPLVVNLAQPTPALGWRNRECPSFLERAAGHFDLVMMLAVVHHMLATERVPLDEIVALAAELTTDWLLVEFVAPEDPMFRRISRGRDALYAYLNADLFERTARERFDIVRQQKLAGSERTLYLLRKKSA